MSAIPRKRLSFFERYLTLWVGICMVTGVLVEVPVMLSAELLTWAGLFLQHRRLEVESEARARV